MAILTIVCGVDTLLIKGVSLSYTSIPITKSLLIQKSYSASGVLKIYNDRVKSTECKLSMSNLSRENYLEIMSFLTDKIIFQLKPFSVTVDTLDLGKGIGVQVSNCYFKNNSTAGLLKPKPPSFYDVTFPFTYKVG